MKILIITGGSKGIGKAIATKYSKENYTVFSIARTKATDVNYQQIIANLTNTKKVVNALNTIFSTIDKQTIEEITLLNNAGSLGVINTVGKLDDTSIENVIQLNTITPLLLSNHFISFTKELTCKKQIINISSGAATNPYHGWSVYCSSKAAIDMMTKTIALEQEEFTNGVKCVAIYPGVVDTNMQIQIRKTPKTDFKNVERFIELKENNQLYSPNFVADKIFEIDTTNQLQNGAILDIRNL